MMKRISALVLVLGLAFTSALGCFAAGGSDISVTYNGSSLDYSVNNPVDSIQNMTPGVESSYSFDLVNKSGSSTDFYMSTKVLQTLLASTETEETGYLVSMTVDNQVIFGNNAPGTVEGNDVGVVVGGQDTAQLAMLNDSDILGNDYVLVATIDPNSTKTLTLNITPNATGTNSYYEGSTGDMQFQFMAEEVTPLTRTEVTTVKNEPTVVTQTRYILTGVQTGDPVVIAPLVGVLALAVLLFIIAGKKKKKKEE